ncbi:aldo/keto reductase [Bacteroidales bacterium OttesenSCG-928-A17]|nr:aldo/keto reductase [Bacteroidales bacterium OttesenSCG-928-A17]
MDYTCCGISGLQLPRISLGLWHNFGFSDNFDEASRMIRYAFNNGVTHFDLANNYGIPPGSAEINFGKILSSQLKTHRDEMIISSKAGHRMWDGPYGDGGSRKSLLASIDQSLSRTGLDYFDLFYSHRYDPNTPLEETAQALIDIVKQGKALYIGISKYPAEQAQRMYELLEAQRVRCLVYQGRYNLFERSPEKEIFPLNEKQGVGFIAFSPLAQGLLSNKYLNGIPDSSRIARGSAFLKQEHITPQVLDKITRLNDLAKKRNQSLAEMSIAWILSQEQVTSVVVGASSVNQLENSLEAMKKMNFDDSEQETIESILSHE